MRRPAREIVLARSLVVGRSRRLIVAPDHRQPGLEKGGIGGRQHRKRTLRKRTSAGCIAPAEQLLTKARADIDCTRWRDREGLVERRLGLILPRDFPLDREEILRAQLPIIALRPELTAF